MSELIVECQSFTVHTKYSKLLRDNVESMYLNGCTI
jgi:hypothetical protein